MSEIFEALRKAQKNRSPADQAAVAEQPAVPSRRWLAEQPAGAAEAPAAPARAREAKAPGWFARLRSSWSDNGRDTPEDAPLLLQPGTLMHEQFRLLRTRMEMAGPGTTMITSALDNEGKTICAINLARALSMSIGTGVILVDADLRHPSTAHLLGIRTHPGLVDYLTGEADWRACLQSHDDGRLRVIPAGTSSPIAPELLGSPRLPQLMAELKAEYPNEYVVFDAPPLLLTVDPLVLARHVDHVLLVVRAGSTPRAVVVKAMEALGPERLRGIVFNAATQDMGHYYYRDYYYGAPSNGTGAR